MTKPAKSRELFFVRHAPVIPAGHLFGQTDVGISAPTPEAVRYLQRQLAECERVYTSPAKRCLQTHAAILPQQSEPTKIAALWEQSFGEWEGKPYGDLPDIGALQGEALVHFTPPQGESFAMLCARAAPAFAQILATDPASHIAIFAHAGTIRAALSIAFESQVAALKCEIGTNSLTRIRVLPSGQYLVVGVNLHS